MTTTIPAALSRHFVPVDHIRGLHHGAWQSMLDDSGAPLPGIRGRSGVAATAAFGQTIGADLIELQAGSAFPLHVHPGEHILYVVAGQGLVHIDSVDHAIQAGDSIYIPAEYPHSVSNPAATGQAMTLLTVGYPHRHLAAADRMRVIAGHDTHGG